MRAFHVEQEPAKAEIMTTLASVLDAFYDLFPSIDSVDSDQSTSF